MGRGRIEVKKIPEEKSRFVTLCKRRSGQKARELSVLRDAQVGLVIFSETGKLFHFSSPRGLDEIIQRYYERVESCSKSPRKSQSPSKSKEVAGLIHKIEVTEKMVRTLKGEELSSLSLTDLNQLECKVQLAMNRIRVKKNQLVEELQRRGNELQQENYMLHKMLSERRTYVERIDIDNVGMPSTSIATYPCQQNYLQPLQGNNSSTRLPGQQCCLSSIVRVRGWQ